MTLKDERPQPGVRSHTLNEIDRNGNQRAYNPAGRNLRSVWSIATQPYPGAHFATFPEALVEPCVKAGTSERGVCPECGAPWRRETTVEYVKGAATGFIGRRDDSGSNGWDGTKLPRLDKHVETTGWQPSCQCHYHHDGAEPTDTRPFAPSPATVLDPFAGSGTTGRVAQRLGRRAVLIDLSGEYLVQAMKRNTEIPLGLESA